MRNNKENTKIVENLLSKGCTKRMAIEYVNHINDCARICPIDEYTQWALNQGFFADSAYLYNLNENNANNYLSDYDFCRLWPLNNWTRIWINDKLTLKMMLSNTELDTMMPRYYYYTCGEHLLPICENPISNREHSIDDFVHVLSEMGEFACKPSNGSLSNGFFKLSIVDGRIYYNDKKQLTQSELETLLKQSPNYIFTEYLKPIEELAAIDSSIHTIRLLVIHPIGQEPNVIGAYLRFSSPKTGGGELYRYRNW